MNTGKKHENNIYSSHSLATSQSSHAFCNHTQANTTSHTLTFITDYIYYALNCVNSNLHSRLAVPGKVADEVVIPLRQLYLVRPRFKHFGTRWSFATAVPVTVHSYHVVTC